MDDLKEFTERYVALWNEPDAERRREQIRRLWSEDGAHLVGMGGDLFHAGSGLLVLLVITVLNVIAVAAAVVGALVLVFFFLGPRE